MPWTENLIKHSAKCQTIHLTNCDTLSDLNVEQSTKAHDRNDAINKVKVRGSLRCINKTNTISIFSIDVFHP